MNNSYLYFFIVIFLIFCVAAFYLSYAIIMAFILLKNRNDVRNQRTITIHELAKIEKLIDRLIRVTVIADRLNPPGRDLALAIQDNFLQGVNYQYFVSRRTTDEEIASYHAFLGHILETSKLISPAASRTDSVDQLPDCDPKASAPYYKIYRIDYDPDDYPYICYEYLESKGSDRQKVLMYRGTEKGVGIARIYEKVTEAVAYSLVTRMRFLQGLLPSDETSYRDADRVGLRNRPALQRDSRHLRVVRNDEAR